MSKKIKRKGIAFNVSMLYIMNIAKLVFPLITLPYLTRVLSVDGYAVVSYVKAMMVYAQLIVGFGFMLSGVKKIAEVRDDLEAVGRESANIVLARGILCFASLAVLLVGCMFIPILKENFAYTMLAFVPIALAPLLVDFMFRGLEQMQIITIRYVLMKTISVGLTLVMVKSDADILWIPILDILSSLVAIILVMYEVKKLGIKLDFSEGFKGAWRALKISSIYFVSEAATTVFGALNTVLIGIFMSKSDVAYWAVCLQLVSAVRSMYTPITNGIYPQMTKTKDANLIKKSLKYFMPLVTAGCLIVLFGAKYILVIAGSAKYAAAAPTMRCLVPTLFFAYPALLLGWPTLGAINRVAETTKTTISAALVQIAGLVLLGVTGNFTLITVALLKSFTELCLMSFRLRYVLKYKNEFASGAAKK